MCMFISFVDSSQNLEILTSDKQLLGGNTILPTDSCKKLLVTFYLDIYAIL